MFPQAAHHSRAAYRRYRAFRRAIRKKRRLIFWASLGAALSITFFTLWPHTHTTVPVLVAHGPISKGSILGADNLVVAQFPAYLVPEGASSQINQVEGATAAVDLTTGTPIIESHTDSSQEMLSSTEALASVTISQPHLIQHATEHTRISVMCTDHVTGNSLKAEGTVIEPAENPDNTSSSGLLPADESHELLLRIKQVDASTIAYCTSQSTPFVTIIG